MAAWLQEYYVYHVYYLHTALAGEKKTLILVHFVDREFLHGGFVLRPGTTQD